MLVYDKFTLAELLHCKPRTVERMELDGRLPPATKVGRRRLWPAVRIERWLAQLKPEKPKAKPDPVESR